MKMNRRSLAWAALALGAFAASIGVPSADAAPSDEGTIRKNVEDYRAALMAADAKAFDKLTAPQMSYSHSDGRVEDKKTFITNATAGKSKILSLDFSDMAVRVTGTAAVARFHWVGESQAVADGKKSNTNLHVLTVWQKQGTQWKLLARSTTKL